MREKGASAAGRLGLVVSNPPYGIRGASIAEDPERAYQLIEATLARRSGNRDP